MTQAVKEITKLNVLKAKAFDLIKQADLHNATIRQQQEAIQELQGRLNAINVEIEKEEAPDTPAN